MGFEPRTSVLQSRWLRRQGCRLVLKFVVGCVLALCGLFAVVCGRRQFGGQRLNGAAFMITEIHAALLFPERVMAAESRGASTCATFSSDLADLDTNSVLERW